MKRREVIPFAEGQTIDLTLTLPGSKSITNRAFLCAALANGKSRINGSLKSDDTKVMRSALTDLGIDITDINGRIEIKGIGFNSDSITFDLHNAGTATRFLTAIMCARPGETVITGNKYMLKRPIADLLYGLRQIDADITCMEEEGYLPLKITGKRLQGGKITIKGDVSSQYFSAILMLAPLLGSPLTLKVDGDLVSKPYIDITLSVLKAFGINVDNHDYQEFYVEPQEYTPVDFDVEGDASAASYFTALNTLHGGNLKFKNLNKKSVQGDVHFIDVLDSLGKGKINMNAMSDVAMTLAVMAPFFDGKTIIYDVSNMRVKETDRLNALEHELKKVGANVTTTEDSITIDGGDLHGALIHTYYDHRMAMAFAVLGTKVPGVIIENPECTNKTYPTFWKDLERAYLTKIRLKDRHLVLTGMRAVGKTHYAKKISVLLGRKWIDIDEEIEKESGKSISAIVETQGWDVFRNLEQKMCSRFANSTEPLIISTGGGVVLRPKNMKALKSNGIVVFIYADPRVLFDRRQKSNARPFLYTNGDITEEIKKVWDERRNLYIKYADVIWDDSTGTVIEERLDWIFA